MTTKAVRALFWKEYRQHVMLLVALFVICVVVQAVGFSMSLYTSEFWPGATPYVPAYLTIAMLFTALYAAGTAAILFTVEHEDRTFQFLRTLPVGGGTVLVGKVAWLLVSTAALGTLLLLESAVWCRFAESSDSSESVFGLMGVAIIEALCWGLFWTTRCRSQLYSILLTFVSVSLASNAVVNLVPRPEYGDVVTAYSSAAGFRLLLAGVVGAIALWDAKKWLQKRVRESRDARVDTAALSPTDHVRLLAAPKRGEFRALLWQAFRQSRKMIIAMPVISMLTYIFIRYYISINELAWHSPQMYLFLHMFAYVFPILFSASVFFRDQQCRRAAMLTNIGVSPGKFWASRILLFGGAYFLLPVLLTGYFLLQSAYAPVYKVSYDAYTYTVMNRTFFYTLRMEEVTVFWLSILSAFCVGQLCSMLTRSLPIAFVLTIGGTFLCLAGVALMEVYRVSWWLMLLPLAGLLLATRLRTGDWMRGRDSRLSFARSAAAIVVPCVIVLAMVPLIRIYSVPNISLGYAMATDTRGMISPDVAAERYNRLVERLDKNLDDITYARQTWLEIQAMTADAGCPNYMTNNPAIIYGVSHSIGSNVDHNEYDREYLLEAMTFLGQMPETMAPASESVRRFFDARLYDLDRNVVRYRNTTLPRTNWSPVITEVTFEREETLRKSERLLFPWEYARTRRVWNDHMQMQSFEADAATNYFYHAEHVTDSKEYERYVDGYHKNLFRSNRAPGTFQLAMLGNENLPASWGENMRIAETERLLAIARCALKLWWLEHGELPENIAQLENEFLNASPRFEVVLFQTHEESGFPAWEYLMGYERHEGFFVGSDENFVPFVGVRMLTDKDLETNRGQYRELGFVKDTK